MVTVMMGGELYVGVEAFGALQFLMSTRDHLQRHSGTFQFGFQVA